MQTEETTNSTPYSEEVQEAIFAARKANILELHKIKISHGGSSDIRFRTIKFVCNTPPTGIDPWKMAEELQHDGYKISGLETEEEKQTRIFEHYKDRLINENPSCCRIEGIPFNVIQYLCQFPGIDPVKMAASLRKDGHAIFFNDRSISAKQNKANEAAVEKAFQKLQIEANSEIHQPGPEPEAEEELEP